MFPIVTWLAVGTMCCLPVNVDSHVPDIFFPFGPGTLDSDFSVSATHDYSAGDIYLCGVGNDHVTVGWNGEATFESGDAFHLFSTPFATNVPSSHVYARTSYDPDLKANVSELISAHCSFTFNTYGLVIATWENMTYNGGNEDSPRNSFQLVLATDSSTQTAVILNYDNLTWAGPEFSQNAAVADVTCGAGTFKLPSSGTRDVVNLGLTSNVGTQGRWIYLVDNSDNFKCQQCQPCPETTTLPTTAIPMTTIQTTAEALSDTSLPPITTGPLNSIQTTQQGQLSLTTASPAVTPSKSNPRCRRYLYRARHRQCGYRRLAWNRHHKPKRG